MPSNTETPTKPVEDSVAKVDGELAVGEDLKFQRRWWIFERWTWRFFSLIVLLDFLGAFGRGPLANAHAHTADGALTLDYERVERFNTPSIITVHLGANAVDNGQVKLWVDDSVVKRLGNQRISPQPLSSATADSGVLYVFAADQHPNSVQFALQPAYTGTSHFTVRLVSHSSIQKPEDALTEGVFVMP